MEFAMSMFLDEKFTPDDDRLNDHSYEELGLICDVCRELVFFKPCIKRVRISHFSHFKDTGKDCDWKTKSNANINTQHTDSESREQSLEKFQSKFKEILDQAIIDNHHLNLSDIDELKNCRVQGTILIDKHKIDINLWLSWFNKRREHIKELASSLYANNESSEIQRRVFSNIVHYLCVPPSENILRDILYYVFFFLDKKVNINNDFEEVCSKVIELIRYVNWEKEYKRAKESLTFNEFQSEPIGKREILNFARTLGHIGVKLDKEDERIRKEDKPGLNIRKYFGLFGSFAVESQVEIQFEYIPGKGKKNKKGKISYVKIKGESRQTLSICWETDVSGQHLIFKHNSVIVATFILMNNGSIQWKPLSEFDKLSTRIAIPLNPHYDPILSTSLEQFFLGWLVSQEFAESLSLRSRKLEYLPALVKLLLRYMSYTAELTETELLGIDMQVSLNEVAKTYKSLISGLVQDTPHMKPIYEVD